MRKYTKKTKHAHAGTSTLHISPQSSIPFSDRWRNLSCHITNHFDLWLSGLGILGNIWKLKATNLDQDWLNMNKY